MKLVKGSAAAKAYMAKIRSAKGKTKKRTAPAKAKSKVGANKLGSFQTTYNAAPVEVKKIIDNIDTSADYRLLIKAQKLLSSKGYFIDYDLNGEIINFKKINNINMGAIKKPTLFKPTKKQTQAAAKRLVKEASHKDTKSHNVNIRVMSGTDGNISNISIDKIKNNITSIERLNKVLMDNKEKMKFNPYKTIFWQNYFKQKNKEISEYIKTLKKENTSLKKHIK